MIKNRGICFAIFAIAMTGLGCSDESSSDTDLCKDQVCPQGSACNPDNGLCIPLCANAVCSPGQTCDPTTGRCVNSAVCGGKTCTEGTLNPTTCECDTLICGGKTCTEGTLNTTTCECDTAVCGGKTCTEGTLNPTTCQCDTLICGGKTCTEGTLNTTTCECDTLICGGKTCAEGTLNTTTCECDTLICGGKTCTEGTLNTTTCECEAEVCGGKTCAEGTLNPTTCQCDIAATEGCNDDKDCKSGPEYSMPEYCNLEKHVCENGACKGKTWDSEYQFCSVSGKISCYDGMCGAGQDESCQCAEGTLCDTKTHTCTGSCEEPNGNIIANWNFGEWNAASPKYWTLEDNAYSQAAVVSRSDTHKTCEYSVSLQNNSTKVARLEGEPVSIPEATFINGNRKYTCTAYVMGEGKINLGYRVLDSNDKQIDEKTEAQTQSNAVASKTWEAISFGISAAPEAAKVQPLIGIRKVDNDSNAASFLVDSITCVPETTICDDVTCEEWEVCSVAGIKDETGKYIGDCQPKSGYCSVVKKEGAEDVVRGCTGNWEQCDETTHTCVGIEGKCATHVNCPTAQRCNKDHVCEDGDRCEGVKCLQWQTCNATTAACEIAEGKCHKSIECTQQSLPLCDISTYTCKAANAVDSNNKPINLVPNGSFEDWEDFSFGTSEKEFSLPVSWFGTEYTVYPGHLVTEFDANNVKAYTTSTHSGGKALQLIYTKSPAKRFSSEGFDVPPGNYDCSLFVRGKGDIRIHSFSSAGEQPKTDFTKVDTDEWQRISFSIKSGKDLRLVFYVGSTDASKDHIQIDDVICTKWTF